MTDDRRPTDHGPDEPIRVLDAVTPPDQWDDITARSATTSATVAPLGSLDQRRSRRPLVLAAAAVLAVVAIAGGLALAARDDGDQDQVVAGPSEDPGFEDPAGIVGRTWELTRFVRDGAELTIPRPEQYPVPTLSVSADGQVTFKACNGGGGGGPAGDQRSDVVGDRIELWGEWMTTLMGCGGAEGEALMALDDAMGQLLRQSPVIELSGHRLTLRDGDTEARFVERIGEPIGPDDDPADDGLEADDQMVASGDVPCAVGIDRSVDRDRPWVLGPGPADPPVLDSGWYDGQATQGVWNLADGNQRIEIHVPGFIVRDLVGARTEEVLLGENWSATAWFTNGWVQIRNFSGGPEGSTCSSFTVTVTGSSETENRDTAVAIASAVVVQEWPAADGSSGGAATTTNTTSPEQSDPDPEQRMPFVPAPDEGTEMTLPDWSADGLRWQLESIRYDGYVRAALDAPLGGVGPNPGPPILDSSYQRAPSALSGCNNISFDIEEREGRLWLQLPPVAASYDDDICDAELLEQWRKTVEILMLGAVPRLVDLGGSPLMVIDNAAGALTFRRP